MSYESTERQIFNQNRRKTTELLIFLNGLYNKLLKDIKDQLAILRQKNEEDGSTAVQEGRLLRLIAKINDQIKELLKIQNTAINNKTVQTERETYLATAKNLEQEVNDQLNFSIAFPPFDTQSAREKLREPIGGLTNTQRNAQDRIVFINGVATVISGAVIAGLSSAEIRERLAALGRTLEKAKNKALLRARQTMSNAYSRAQDIAISIAEGAGVEGTHDWISIIDAVTRPAKGVTPPPNHRSMNGRTRDEETGLFTFDSGETIKAPRIRGEGTAGTSQIMGCRCRRQFNITGVDNEPE